MRLVSRMFSPERFVQYCTIGLAFVHRLPDWELEQMDRLHDDDIE